MTQWSVESDEEENVYTKQRKLEEVERMTPKHLLKPGRHFQTIYWLFPPCDAQIKGKILTKSHFQFIES